MFALIIPTLNAEPWLGKLLPAIRDQTVQPKQIIVMDSQSSDATADLFRSFGAKVVEVMRADFDHGGTRQAALQFIDKEVEVVVYLTQDALLANDVSFERLVGAFRNPEVGMAYGRQLPRQGAAPIEAHGRLFSYSNDGHIVGRESIQALGIRASFCSNSFAAYRIDALRESGGFPNGCIFGEDAVMALSLLNRGWLKEYVPGAQVYHSHSYSIAEEFRRYFDIGVLHVVDPSIKALSASKTSGEGLRFVKSELAYLCRRRPLAIPEAIIRTLAKYSAYKAGREFRRFPVSARRMLSLNRQFWDRASI